MKFLSLFDFLRPVALAIVALVSGSDLLSQAEVATGRRGIVATVHPIATSAAINAFREGGNAIDAAVAAALTLGVVDGHNSGIGGGCLILIRLANGRLIAIDGREAAPLAASRDMYLRNGQADPDLSLVGPLACGVPGALMAYDHALRNFGRLKLRDLLLPAARIAESGFVITPEYGERLKTEAKALHRFEATRAIFLHADGTPKEPGETLRQADLGQTYRAIAAQGIGWFYDGPFAHATGEWMSQHGGLLSAADLALYRIALREPLVTTYRGLTVVGFPPPSSGGVHLAQILNILEHFDLRAMGQNSAEMIHVVAEAMKLAFADRAHWLGDPDHVRVPVGLVSKSYADGLHQLIKSDRVTAVPAHGLPPDATENYFGKHTTHFSTADAQGNWVACTATINTSFGSKVVIPGTGVVLNNEMDDFSIQPGVTNYFGLPGAEANAIAPRKRPLSSMSPTLLLKRGQPFLALGAAGGPTIISQTLLALLHTIDFGADLESALTQARFHQQWIPDELRIERKAGEKLLGELRQRGHKVIPVGSIGAAQAVGINPLGGGFVGVHDPRVRGQAKGW